MNRIIEVAKERDDIKDIPTVDCPRCADRLYSLFDKLYIKTFGMCTVCTPDNELEINGDQIFQIL